MELVRVFVDWWLSWENKYKTRDWLDQMIEYLQEQNKEYTKVSKVIIDDMDRIIRDVSWWREIKNRIEKLWGAKIFSLKQEINDSPEGRMMQSVTMSFKQYDRENNARRTKDRQRGRMLDWYRCFNPMPWYRYQFEDDLRKKGWKVLVIDWIEWMIIREWLQLLARWIIHRISWFIQFLKQKGYKTKSGKALLKASNINRLFEREKLLFYAGYIDYSDWDLSMITGRHEAFITLDDIEKILDAVDPTRWKKYANNSKEKNEKELPLRWSLRCNGCNKPMTWAPSKNKLWNYYFYYTCRNKECSICGKSINNKVVHLAFENKLSSMKMDDKYINSFKDIVTHIRENQSSSLDEELTIKSQRYNELTNTIDKLQERLFTTDNEQLVSVYEEKIVELSKQKNLLKQDMEEYSEEKIDLPYIFTNTIPLITNIKEVWAFPDPTLKKKLLSYIFSDEIYFDQKNGIQTPCIPLIYWVFNDSDDNFAKWQGLQGLNLRRGALETPALPLS